MQHRRWALFSMAAAGALVVLLAVACGSKRVGTPKPGAQSPALPAPGTSQSAIGAPAAAATAAAAAARPAAAAPSTSAGAAASSTTASSNLPDAAGGAAADLDRKIIRNADIGLVVADVDSAFSSIASIATGLGGYVAGSNLTQSGEKLRGTVTLRVPASGFDQAMAQLKELAVKVQRENISSQDVTQEYADLDARVANLQATEDQLRALLATVREKSNNTNDILTVYRELTDINGQIEQAKGRQQYLSKLSDLATLSVELIPQEQPATAKPEPAAHHAWSAVDTLGDAVQVLGKLGQAGATGLIWLGVIGGPCAILAAMLYLAAVLARRRWVATRRTP